MISDWRIRGVGLGSGIFKADTAAPEKPPAIQDQGKMLSPWEDTPHKNHKTLLGYVNTKLDKFWTGWKFTRLLGILFTWKI